jgi:hypothetical protein
MEQTIFFCHRDRGLLGLAIWSNYKEEFFLNIHGTNYDYTGNKN